MPQTICSQLPPHGFAKCFALGSLLSHYFLTAFIISFSTIHDNEMVVEISLKFAEIFILSLCLVTVMKNQNVHFVRIIQRHTHNFNKAPNAWVPYIQVYILAISIKVMFSLSAVSRLVNNALAVSKDVRQVTPVSMDVLRIWNPSLFLSLP